MTGFRRTAMRLECKVRVVAMRPLSCGADGLHVRMNARNGSTSRVPIPPSAGRSSAATLDGGHRTLPGGA
eukprot:756989-Alexandrium_andersonii.AAC.1